MRTRSAPLRGEREIARAQADPVVHVEVQERDRASPPILEVSRLYQDPDLAAGGIGTAADVFDSLHHLGSRVIARVTHALRQVHGTDEEHVDSFDREDLVEALVRRATLELRHDHFRFVIPRKAVPHVQHELAELLGAVEPRRDDSVHAAQHDSLDHPALGREYPGEAAEPAEPRRSRHVLELLHAGASLLEVDHHGIDTELGTTEMFHQRGAWVIRIQNAHRSGKELFLETNSGRWSHLVPLAAFAGAPSMASIAARSRSRSSTMVARRGGFMRLRIAAT